MKNFKIAYYTEVDLSLSDGPAVNEQEFLNRINEHWGEEFIFITSIKNENFKKAQHMFFVPEFRLVLFFSQLIKNLKIVMNIKKYNIDVLVCRVPDFPLFPFLYKLFNKNTKLAIKTAALWSIEQEKIPNTIKNFIYKKLNNFFIKKVYQWADIVDTALPYAVKALHEGDIVERDKIYLIENGINISKFSVNGDTININELKNAYPILGFAGSKPSERGVKQTLEVAKRIRNTYPNVAVLILGNDSNLEQLISKYKQYNFVIHSPGVIDYRYVDKYIRVMTIGFSFYEADVVEEHGNASQKVRQYLSCGKPVFSIYHNHEFIKNHDLGCIFKDEDYDLMAEKALDWIKKIDQEKDELVTRISSYAAENFSSASTFKQRIDLYNELLVKKQ